MITMIYQRLLLLISLLCTTYAIQIKPAPVYGPPLAQKQRLPHREYGVPQQIPFREYGPPTLKYGPPKFLNNFGKTNTAVTSGLHEQVKAHFGVPKPFYGPPASYKPATKYGPPIRQPSVKYGAPALKILHKPASQYGPPLKLHHSSPPPQSLPLTQPAALFKPEHQPSSSYGPPPSGPIPQVLKQSYGPPADNYGPPPLPNFNQEPETTLLITTNNGDDNFQQHHHHQQQQQQQHHFLIQQQQQQQQQQEQQQHQHHLDKATHQLQIQIDTNGHTHSAQGAQAPFHTACEGWKPIPGPSTGPFTDHSSIHTQGGYSHVTQNGHAGHVDTFRIETDGSGPGSALTDEQLVAVALQSGNFDGNDNALHSDIQSPPQIGPGIQFKKHHHHLNHHQEFKNANNVHSSIGGISDTYSKPPSDSFSPGSIHALKYHAQGPPPSLPNAQYGLPLPPDHNAANFAHHHTHNGLGIQYGKQSGNLQSHHQILSLPPTKPVSFRPPVPQGLLESIGATVKHVDKFGSKPIVQTQTYIPPAANEIALSSTSNLNSQYGAPHDIIQQQLPYDASNSNFVHASLQQQQQQHQHQQQQYQQHEQINNIQDVYGVPAQSFPQNNYLPPPSGPSAPSNSYIPPLAHTSVGALNQQNGITYTAKAIATFENAYGASEQSHQTLPLQQQQHHNQQHQNSGYQGNDCGQGPILLNGVSGNTVSQSIPIAEHHSLFYNDPRSSYGPPPSGNVDNLSYASETTGHSALPLPNNNNNYADLENLNIMSNEIPSDHGDYHNQHGSSYQLEISKNPKQSINHAEILSHDLLQSILQTIEQPQTQPQLQLQQQYVPANHKAENRLDRNNQIENGTHFDIDNETANSEKVAVIAPSTKQETDKNEEQKLLKTIIVNDDDVDDIQNQDQAKH